MTKGTSKYFIIIIISLCIFSRLPFLTNSNMAMDSDECIVGLMAKHLHEGKDVPLFFYGQAYGFSAIEVGCVSVFYKLFGVNDIAVKLAMLFLWTIGIVFFYKALRNLDSGKSWLPFIITLLFVFAPSWYLWSMKARGGYLTSFLIFNIVMFLITKPGLHKSKWLMVVTGVIGILLIFMYESQPLWVVGLLPILVYKMIEIRSWKAVVTAVLGAGLTMLFFVNAKSGLSNFWIPPVISMKNLDFGSLYLIPEKVFHNLNGHYVYANNFTPGVFAAIWGSCFTLFAFVVCIWVYVNTIRAKSKISFLFIFALSVTFSVGYLILIKGDLPRYQLPLTGCLLLMLFELIKYFNHVKWIIKVVYGVIAIGAISMFEFKPLFEGQNDKANVIELVNTLEDNGVQFVFGEDGLLQWQIMFYSDEEIQCRYLYNTDRYQPYVDAVNRAYLLQQEKTALVGIYSPNTTRNSMINVSDIYYVFPNPMPHELRDLGFELPL